MKTLRARLMLSYVLVALVAVVVVAGLTSVLIQRGFDSLAVRQADSEAADIAAQLAELYQRRDGWRGAQLYLRRQFPALPAGDPARRRRVQVLDAGGAVIFDSRAPLGGVGRRASPPPLAAAARAPIVVEGSQIGAVLVSSAGDELSQAERDFLARVRLSVILGSLAAVAVALLAGLLSAASVTRPLRSLTSAARRLATGARHDPLPPPADAELAELATSFNSMAAELERQEGLRRQQVADIAHELRTPLSVLRLQLESIADGVEQPTPDLLGSLTEEVSLLSRLVDDLRLLSLAEAGQLQLQVETLDLGDLQRQAALKAAARARQQQIDLAAQPPPQPLLVRADPQRMAQVLGNLIENALRYTPPGGAVRIGLRAEGARAIISVSDTGPGIAPAELEKIFDRFWRADRARARETGGSGLGLAIVRRLVEVQGGQVWATSTVGHGATFHVALPLAR